VVAVFFDELRQAGRDEQYREQDDENALHEVGPVGSRQTAEHPIENDDNGNQRNEHIAQGQAVNSLDTNEWHRKFRDRGEHRREVEHIEHESEHCVGRSQRFRLVAFDEPVPQREVSHTAIPDRGEPVNRRDEEPHQGRPDAAQSTRPACSTDRDRFVSPGPGTEGGKGLQNLPKPASAHEVVFLAFDAFHRPQAHADHAEEIDSQDEIVEYIHGLFSLRALENGEPTFGVRQLSGQLLHWLACRVATPEVI